MKSERKGKREREIGRGREAKRERFFETLVADAGMRPGSQKLHFDLPTWMAGAQVLEPSSAAFLDTLPENWLRSRAMGT